MLLRNTGFTAASVLALALGIGINTGAFTAYKALVGRSLDARDPGRMVNLALTLQSGAHAYWFSYPDYQAYRDNLHALSGLIAFCIDDQLRLTGAGGIVSERAAVAGSLFGRLGLLPPAASNAEFASAFIVSENYFSVLGVPPLRGRAFESIPPRELAASPAVLISENYWQKRFTGDPAVLGKTVRLNGAPFTIVGITPHDFVGTSIAVPDFWLPLSLEPQVHPESNPLRDRENLRLRLFGRLAPGVTTRQAQAEVNLLASRLRNLHDRNSEWSRPATASLSPGSSLPGINAALRFTILLIMIAVGIVLVIACANVASLQLARATIRQNELSMRLSLGATRARVIQQLLTESALLGLFSGVIALPFTWAILKTGATMFRQAFPIEIGTIVLHVTPDVEVFAYLLAMSVFAGLLFGLAPALESSRSALFSTIRGNAGTSPVRSRRLRDLLIGFQVAVSLLLLIAGSMLIRSSLHALGMPTGYDGKHVVDLDFRFPEESKYNADRRLAVIRELRSRVAAIPGVAEITSARAPDDSNLRSASVSLNGDTPSSRNRQAILYYTWVQANYFRTLGVPLLLGSGFAAQTGQPEHSVILSESAARQLWPGRNPIGRSLRLGTGEQFHVKGEFLPDGPTWQVIGIAADTRGVESDGSDSAQVYLPLPEDRLRDYPILIRTRSDPMLITRALDSVVSSVDPDLVASTSTLQEMLRQTPSFLGSAFAAAVATLIGLFGLLLAAMGIYGTVSYIAVARTREIGIRMALGAQKRTILGLMMRDSTRPVVAGLVIGMLLAVGAAQLLRGVLYGLHTVDPLSFLYASLLFLSISLIATWPPSRRAMRVDPMVALRYE